MVLSCRKNVGEKRVLNGYRSTVEKESFRERPRKGWIDGVKELLSHRCISTQEGERCIRNRVSWRVAVYKR